MLLFSSCGTTDKVLTSHGIHKRKYNAGWYVPFLGKNSTIETALNTPSKIKVHEHVYENPSADASELSASSDNEVLLSESPPLVTLHTKKSVQKRQVKPIEDCEFLVLKNGKEIHAKVLEVGVKEIKYKLCDNQTGPVFVANKSDVFMIKYPNGTNTVISEIESEPSLANRVQTLENRSLEPLSLIGFISSIIGLFVLAILFGPAAITLSIIGLVKNLKNPDKWKGKGLAIAGMIIGSVGLMLFLILLSLL